ncbi:hypothetical protein [Streptomyces armeniacus]|uniref:hypothetical protein n=1 Tax=Streptomyces armeniacus TaxID=83291 RepID=UPI001AD7ECFE|nr:hypothetical protein [Streptomyces armeniacus]
MPDPDRVPKTREEALRFAREVVAEPESWGAGYVRSSPYKSGPRRTSVLGEDCVWKQRALPSSEFVSVVRRSELPAEDGKGTLRVTAVVTVHRDTASAEWKMARILEEPLRCPDQQLDATERITGLRSGGDPFQGRRDVGDDFLQETGRVHGGPPGGPHPYVWAVTRIGSVTVGAAVKGSEGHDVAAVQTVGARGTANMSATAELLLEERK